MEELVGKRKYIYEVTPHSFSTPPLSVHGACTIYHYYFCYPLLLCSTRVPAVVRKPIRRRVLGKLRLARV